MTYKIGMRAWFGVPADKFLPSLIADAEDEVAAAFKGVFKILTGKRSRWMKSDAIGVTKVLCESGTSGQFGRRKLC
jgi:hypothetical protein